MKKLKSKSSHKRSPSQKQSRSDSQTQTADRDNTVRSVADAAILNTLLAALSSDSDHPQQDNALASYPDLSQWIDFQPLAQTPSSEKQMSVALGQRFGKWKIISLGYENPSCKEPHFLLRCDCGSVKVRPQALVISGQSKSCGCKKK
jgi:hypothetical protein